MLGVLRGIPGGSRGSGLGLGPGPSGTLATTGQSSVRGPPLLKPQPLTCVKAPMVLQMGDPSHTGDSESLHPPLPPLGLDRGAQFVSYSGP